MTKLTRVTDFNMQLKLQQSDPCLWGQVSRVHASAISGQGASFVLATFKLSVCCQGLWCRAIERSKSQYLGENCSIEDNVAGYVSKTDAYYAFTLATHSPIAFLPPRLLLHATAFPNRKFTLWKPFRRERLHWVCRQWRGVGYRSEQYTWPTVALSIYWLFKYLE